MFGEISVSSFDKDFILLCEIILALETICEMLIQIVLREIVLDDVLHKLKFCGC